MKRLVKCVVGILVVLLAGSAVQAELQLVENFDGLATGNPNGLACTGVMGGTWDSQGEGTGNVNVEDNSGSKVLHFRSHSSGSRRAVGFNGITNPITEGETGAVFLRFWFSNIASELPRTYIGLISDASDDPITSTSANTPTDIIAGFGLLDNGSGGFDVTTTDGSTVLKAGFVREQWYNIWIAADNETDTFDLYISEAAGPAGEPTLPTPGDLVKSSIPFGNPTTDPLNGMILTCPTGTGQSARAYVDEIWWDGDQGLVAPTQARKPSPANEATDVPRDVVLGWKPGAGAVQHDVYLGTSFDDVTNATTTVDPGGVYNDSININIYTVAERLALGETYYWRVDEVEADGATIHKGDVWSFTVELLAYPIENIIATASSSEEGKEAENTVNGSGLDDSGLLHSNESVGNMWLSSQDGPQPAWIEFEFERINKLHEMWVWNSNDSLEYLIGLGFKNVTIKYSADGNDYVTFGTMHEFARAPGEPDYAHDTTIDFDGVAAKYVKLTANSNWEGIFDQFGLSEVRFFSIPVHAREPDPNSGAKEVDLDIFLGWGAGRDAAEHKVYIDSDEQAVIGGTVPATTVTETSYGPLALDLGTTYYWRIDEVNDTEATPIWEGSIWSLTTQDYLVVDDFESYDVGNSEIWWAWKDGLGYAAHDNEPAYPGNGTGSAVGNETSASYTEETIVHGGKQSMPLFYDNSGASYSEATVNTDDLAIGRDWTAGSPETLVLWFYGTPGNTGQLYVKINGSMIPYDGEAGDIATPWWQRWTIDLTSSGVDVQSVSSLTIGVDGSGSGGTLYIDDIVLYRAAPAAAEQVYLEAEAAIPLGVSWRSYNDPDSSGGGHIGSEDGDGDDFDIAPGVEWTAVYNFNVPVEGVYTVVLRAQDIGDDSFWVRIPSATSQTHEDPDQPGTGWVLNDIGSPEGVWEWEEVQSFDHNDAVVNWTLPAGTHTLEIARREDGVLLDAILITSDVE